MTLQINRGAGYPSAVLAAGEPYHDTTNDIFWLGDGSNNTPYVSSNGEPDWKIQDFTIPAISAGARQVVEIVMPTLRNPSAALLAFYKDTAVDAEILAMKNSGGAIDGYQNISGKTESSSIGEVVIEKYTGMCSDQLGYLIRVTEDYNKCRTYDSGGDKYGSGAGSDITPITDVANRTYDALTENVMVGWYTVAANGAFELDKKVELQSAWLSTVDGVTTLSIAFFNQDSSANTAKDLKVVVYE